MTNVDKYLKIVTWAKQRYTVDGELTLSKGDYLYPYKRIEIAAWNKYMR